MYLVLEFINHKLCLAYVHQRSQCWLSETLFSVVSSYKVRWHTFRKKKEIGFWYKTHLLIFSSIFCIYLEWCLHVCLTWENRTDEIGTGRRKTFFFFFPFDEIFTVRIYQRPEQKVGVSHERLGLTLKNQGVLLPPRGQSGRSQAAVEKKPAKTVSQVTRPSYREHSLQTHWGVIWGHCGLSHLLCLKSWPHNRLSSTWILMTSLN